MPPSHVPHLTPQSCAVFEQPFFQFAQLKKYCPELIPQLKADYKREWDNWKRVVHAVAALLGTPFAKPHIESWTNGWQVRSHFFAFFKYEHWQNSAAILSLILNRRRLQISLDWHGYRADRSQFRLSDYQQWWEDFDARPFAGFDLWRGSDSEYADFRPAADFSAHTLAAINAPDFWCIGKNIEKDRLKQAGTPQFIAQSLRQLLPLYEKCHKVSPCLC